jgi:hypothetical protein
MPLNLIPSPDCFLKFGWYHSEFGGGLFTKLVINATCEKNLVLIPINFASFTSGISITLLFIPFLVYCIY